MRLPVAAFTICLSLTARTPRQDIQITTTAQAEVAPNGMVRIDGSLGQLDVEGWDQPGVEITVTKSIWRADKARAEGLLRQIQVKVERKETDLEISTVLPSRNLFTRPLRDSTEFALEYRIRVPRATRLEIRHQTGDVRISGLTGPIQASVRTGDLQLRLPDSNPYAIDAHCRIGGVFSDFAEIRGGHRVETPGPRASLRVGVGGIQILKAQAV